eukprot:scaffold30286_cov73-Skeletonema_marinoi.AAC.1
MPSTPIKKLKSAHVEKYRVCKCRIGIMFCLTVQRAKKSVGGKSILVIVLVTPFLCAATSFRRCFATQLAVVLLRGAKSNNIMPERVKNIPPAGDKKRKEVSVAANNESGPPKKRVYKRCSVDGCGNWRIEGGVCIRHGAQVKRCSVGECNNHIVSGAVCIRHGAKVKLCSVDGCTNHAKKRGLCVKHGAKVKKCSVDGCTNQRQRRGVCWRHRTHSNIAPPPAQ